MAPCQFHDSLPPGDAGHEMGGLYSRRAPVYAPVAIPLRPAQACYDGDRCRLYGRLDICGHALGAWGSNAVNSD